MSLEGEGWLRTGILIPTPQSGFPAEGCQSPLSERPWVGRRLPKAWLRPREVGEEVGLGARRGRGPRGA